MKVNDCTLEFWICFIRLSLSISDANIRSVAGSLRFKFSLMLYTCFGVLIVKYT